MTKSTTDNKYPESQFPFERLKVWQTALTWNNTLHKTFVNSEKNAGASLIVQETQRRAFDVLNRIAEGKARYDQFYFVKKLLMAKASLYQTSSLLRLAISLKQLDLKEGEAILEIAKGIDSQIGGLIYYIKNKDEEEKKEEKE